jgi:hypothetical protein
MPKGRTACPFRGDAFLSSQLGIKQSDRARTLNASRAADIGVVLVGERPGESGDPARRADGDELTAMATGQAADGAATSAAPAHC